MSERVGNSGEETEALRNVSDGGRRGEGKYLLLWTPEGAGKLCFTHQRREISLG